MKRAFAYARTSKEDKGDPAWSIPTQIKRIEERVARDDKLDLIGVYEDRDQSGAMPFDKRRSWPDIERLIKPGDIIIVNDFSRFSRDKKQAEDKLVELLDRDIDVLSLSMEGVDYRTADGEMLTGINLQVAHWQRRKIIENLLQIHWKMFCDGKALGCRPPLGYDYDLIAKQFSVNPEEAELVRRIFALKIAGHGFQTIAHRLASENVPTKREGKWHLSTVQTIINNRWYIGEREYKGEIKPMDVEPIIDRETWDMVHASIRHINHAVRTEHLLSGLLNCSECGHVLYRYNCWQDGMRTGAADWRCPNGHVSIRESTTEKTLLEKFFAHIDPARYERTMREREKVVKRGEGRRGSLAKRLAAVERRQSRLLDELAKDDTTLTRPAFAKKNGKLQGEIDELEQALRDIDDRALLVQRPAILGADIGKDWATLDVSDQQAALRLFVDHLDIVPANGIQGSKRIAVSFKTT